MRNALKSGIEPDMTVPGEKSWRLIFLSILLTLFFLPGLAEAQFYFGKNKVQYTQFDWQVMETEHFRIYFYVEEEYVARMAARVVEDGYRELAARFRHEIYDPIPLIIYSSPNYFTQTNVTPLLLPESVGGFTESLKGRVVVPYHGSYSDFAHVLRHELVHVFTFAKLESVITRQRYFRMAPPPLWFTEGLAEFWSESWDSEADMIMKDMTLSGSLPPVTQFYEYSGSYFIYKLGQSVCRFIDDEYGSDKLVMILENWWKGENFEEIIWHTLGDRMEQFSSKWIYAQKKRYFPEIGVSGLADQESHRLTRKGYAVKGVPITLNDGPRSGEWIIFKANRMGYSGLYMIPPDGEVTKIHTLLKGERSASFESLHLLESGIDANNAGQVLFSSKSEEKDVLYRYDLNSRKVMMRYDIPEPVTISSPRFSPDGTQAVFGAADKSGLSNIYILDLGDGRARKVTDDVYYDLNPAFTPEGDAIIFSSDRGRGGEDGALNLFRISVTGGPVTQLTSGSWKDLSPEPTDQGLFFASDRNGAFNIFRLNADGSAHQITSLLTGAYDPRLTPDKKNIVFTGYQNMGFHLYRTPVHDTLALPHDTAPSGEFSWRPGTLDKKYVRSSVRYKTDYSFDIAQSAISYDPVYGSIGGLQIALSDMLGNNAYYFLLTNTAESKDDFLTSFNVGVTYLNKKRRLNWGVGVYHFYDEYYNDFDGYFFERQVGGLGYVNYPLSKFNRVEATTYIRYSDKDSYIMGYRRRAPLLSNYISVVSDNSLWDISGPLEGHRYNITLGLTTALDEGKTFNRMGMIDLRHYIRLGKYSAYASRLFAYSSTGIEPQRIYFGGSWSFRGYGRRAFYNRNIIFSSNELRFPLIDNLLVGFPFGGINFQAIRGALFFDAGSAWDNEFDELLGSFGAGFRVALGGVVLLRFDFARTTDFSKISSNTDFEFFFGWNF